jgi:hypothetical protein
MPKLNKPKATNFLVSKKIFAKKAKSQENYLYLG